MYSRGVRGAITLENNSKDEIKKAVIEIVNTLLRENEIDIKDISFAIFTTTCDINKDFPAKYARINCGFKNVPMMCYHELDIEGSLKMCLRVLLNINTNKEQDEIKHIYLKGAKVLRQDLN